MTARRGKAENLKRSKSAGRRRRPRATQARLADVATAAAVSTATASRALTRPETVSDQLRKRVTDAAGALGYIANGAARALAQRRSGWVGVLAGDLGEPGTAPALAALQHGLGVGGRALLLGMCGKDVTTLDAARMLLGRNVEALVFLGVAIPPDLAELRGIQRVPCVSVDRTDGSGFVAGSGLDLGRAGKLVADYLLQLGHRRLAVISASHSAIGDVLLETVRAEGVLAGAEVELLIPDDGLFAEQLAHRFALPNAPTAAICSSDVSALAMMQACASLGIDVPERMSIVGLGDTPLARCISPTLTSLRIPSSVAGLAAAEYVLAVLAGIPPARVECAVKLVIRRSSGRPGLNA
jgi:LacI family transcriptional regulator